MTGIVHRAVLLAAGKGTRLGALTAEFPKPLLDVGGRPIIVHILDGLLRAGVDEVTIVTGHAAEALEAELGNGAESGLRISYVRQTRLDGTAHALALARDAMGDESFFFGWGDIMVAPENYRNVVKASRLADAVIAVNDVDDPFAGGAVYVDEATGLVTRMVEKPPRGTSTTRWNNAGFGVLPPAIWDQIRRAAAVGTGTSTNCRRRSPASLRPGHGCARCPWRGRGSTSALPKASRRRGQRLAGVSTRTALPLAWSADERPSVGSAVRAGHRRWRHGGGRSTTLSAAG